MTFKTLGEISNPKQWKNLSISQLKTSGYPVYGANGIIGFFDEYNHEKPTVAITCRGATCGNIHITLEKSYISSNAMALDGINEAECNLNYLAQYLRYRGLSDVTTGAAQPQITRANLEKIKIPFPHIDVQNRIAHLLIKVEELTDQRKQTLQQLDDLLKNIFIEMFGDPIRNEKEWSDKPCEEVVTDIQSGTSYGGEVKEYIDEDEYGVLKISAVTKGDFNPKEFKAVKKSSIKKPLRFVTKGDFLFSRANTIELVAACCIVDDDYTKLFLPDKLWALTFSNLIDPQYFNFLLKNESFRNQVRKQASGGHDSMLNISMKKFRSLNIPIPPHKLQQKFTSIVEKIDGIKSQYQDSLTELENLYGALSQKAFKGELDLSRIPLSEVDVSSIHEVTLIDKVSITDEVHRFVENPMAVPKERKKYLRNLFDEYLKLYKGENLSLDNFWQEANFKTIDMMDEFDKPWGLEDYEQIKKWLFELIQNGDLEQSFSEKNKQIELKVKG